MTLGEKLQGLRAEVGLCQEELAERLGVSRQAVSKWELDKTVPDVKYIVALSELFGVTTDCLLKNAEAAPPQSQPPFASPEAITEAIHQSSAPGLFDRACLLLAAGGGLFAMLLLVYLGFYCFGFHRMGTWPLLLVLLGAPVLLVISCGLLRADAPFRNFRRGVAVCCMLWGFSIALLFGFGEVIDDLLVSQVEGAASIPLLLLLLAALLLPLWCVGHFLANLVIKRRKP